MTMESAIEIIEKALWPESIAGWLCATFLAFGSLFLIIECSNFISDFLKISKWENSSGTLLNIETKKGEMHAIYKYKTANSEKIGEKIGIARRVWHSVSQRDISKFENYFKNKKPIPIKYNPQDMNDSTYAFNSTDIYPAIFVISFPITLTLLFSWIAFFKILKNKKYL